MGFSALFIAMESHNKQLADRPPTVEGPTFVLGSQDHAKMEADGVVRGRSGSVLRRGFILKTGDSTPKRDGEIEGAPNFRSTDEKALNVFGVAQPTMPGLKSVLTVLGCQPADLQCSSVTQSVGQDKRQAVWVNLRQETLVYCNGQPYVLRDASSPCQPLNLSNRAQNLEDIERRLKADAQREASKHGGMILVHDEAENGQVVPSWISVDLASVRTPKEVYAELREQGWRVTYHRIPMAPDLPMEDAYLDAFVHAVKDADPVTTALVFNCGTGVARTTFALAAACLLRRKQLLRRGYEDTFPHADSQSGISTPLSPLASPGTPQFQATQFFEQAAHQKRLTKSLLQISRVLDRTLPPTRHGTAVDLFSSRPALLEALCKAHMGDYQVVLSLISGLDHGRQTKQLVDQVIDSCDAHVNLRETIVEYRIKYSACPADSPTRQAVLDKALRALERYLDLILFAAYVEVEAASTTGVSFSAWLMARPDIRNQIKSIRASSSRSAAFAPIHDLSSATKTEGAGAAKWQDGFPKDLDRLGDKVLGDEWADHVIHNRDGIVLRASTLLQSDTSPVETDAPAGASQGAADLRQIIGTTIFTTGQATQDALPLVLQQVRECCPGVDKVVWVCLQAEPLIMINGMPSFPSAAYIAGSAFHLASARTDHRHMHGYPGISVSGLETLEDRLKSDVIAELFYYQGSVLLHRRRADGEVVPVWESVETEDVRTMKEVMENLLDFEKADGFDLVFQRIPVMPDSVPHFHHTSQLIDIFLGANLRGTAFVLHDQLGQGSSSLTAVMLLLIQRWLLLAQDGVAPSPIARTAPTSSWHFINSCVRVLSNGMEVKRVVDETLDAASPHSALRDAIHKLTVRAEDTDDPEERQLCIEKGQAQLGTYYYLLLFQAYLDDRTPDEEDPRTFESWVKGRPVFQTLEVELERSGLQGLKPIYTMGVGDTASEDEVAQAVARRSGTILSAQTILKSDFFPVQQKLSLPERVDGAANYRRMPLVSTAMSGRANSETWGASSAGPFVYGSGMPSGPGLRNALTKMGAGPNGTRWVIWTSLREEPVLYIKARPHVLRLIHKPVHNIETTGVTAAVVERMENTLKQDVLTEIRSSDGKLLLHDEVETRPGVYEVITIWETVEEKDLMTPREFYDEVIREGYQVEYLRVAITDEQAPLPATLQLIIDQVANGLSSRSDFVFNCQMGRGRTTTGMVVASLIATVEASRTSLDDLEDEHGWEAPPDMSTVEAQYHNGEYKTVLYLVTVLRHGREAKRLTDHVIDEMQGVQNLREAIYTYKLKADTAPPGSIQQQPLVQQAVNYLLRYGTLIVLTSFLLELKEHGIPIDGADFPAWMLQHREIRSVLRRKTLD